MDKAIGNDGKEYNIYTGIADLYDLALHEEFHDHPVHATYMVKRVIGGWIYLFPKRVVFVPFIEEATHKWQAQSNQWPFHPTKQPEEIENQTG